MDAGATSVPLNEGMEPIINPQFQQVTFGYQDHADPKATILCCNCGVPIPPNPAVQSQYFVLLIVGNVFGLHKDDNRHY